ncbi:MAG: hypothetical protein Q9167_003939 [Letrouitia subvulpina]
MDRIIYLFCLRFPVQALGITIGAGAIVDPQSIQWGNNLALPSSLPSDLDFRDKTIQSSEDQPEILATVNLNLRDTTSIASVQTTGQWVAPDEHPSTDSRGAWPQPITTPSDVDLLWSSTFDTFDTTEVTSPSATQTLSAHRYTVVMADNLLSLPPQKLASGVPLNLKVNPRDSIAERTLASVRSHGTADRLSPGSSNGTMNATTSLRPHPPNSTLAFSSRSSTDRSLKKTLRVLSYVLFHFLI